MRKRPGTFEGYFKVRDERTGFLTDLRRMTREPGTRLYVEKRESDGSYNLRDHPQTKSPRYRREKMPFGNSRFTAREISDIFTDDVFLVLEQESYSGRIWIVLEESDKKDGIIVES